MEVEELGGGIMGSGKQGRAKSSVGGGSVEPGFVDGTLAQWPGCLTEHLLCYELNCVPSDSYFEVLTSIPQTVTLFGIRVFTETIKLKWGQPEWTQGDQCPYERGTCGDGHTQRENAVGRRRRKSR